MLISEKIGRYAVLIIDILRILKAFSNSNCRSKWNKIRNDRALHSQALFKAFISIVCFGLRLNTNELDTENGKHLQDLCRNCIWNKRKSQIETQTNENRHMIKIGDGNILLPYYSFN